MQSRRREGTSSRHPCQVSRQADAAATFCRSKARLMYMATPVSVVRWRGLGWVVAGSKAPAEQGTLIFMTSGDK